MEENSPTQVERPEYRLSQPLRWISRGVGALLLLDGVVVEVNALYNLVTDHLHKAEFYGQGGFVPTVVGAIAVAGSFRRKAAESAE